MTGTACRFESMYRIGPFATLTGLSIKALRLYHEMGLLVPAAVERGSRYRVYAHWQISRARQIHVLRDLGLSLSEIGALVSADRSGAAAERHVLAGAERRLASLIAEKSRELEAIRARLAWLDAGHPSRIVVRSERSMLVASIRDRLDRPVDSEEMEHELAAGVGECARVGRRGTLWHACGHDAGALDAEVFVEVAAGARTRGRVRVSELPAITAACAPATDDDGAVATFVALQRWMEREGRAIVGPKRELRHPASLVPAVPDVLLEVQFPFAYAAIESQRM
jgi:DNA-binding transcriptional MerR regulator